ncbi:MAG: hypothetical protein AAGF56_00955 [Pseudomonadota bacterium]
MIARRSLRRCHGRGFVLAEALVALTVAALTLALMTSATWGLRQAALQPATLQQAATDWLTARRVLQAWAGSATANGTAGLVGRFAGGPDRLRFVLDDGTSRDHRPITISLDITQEDGIFTLSAARQIDVRDVRLISDQTRRSTLITSDEPLSFVYQMQAPLNAEDRLWTYEPAVDQGLPTAIGIERGSDRMIVVPLPATRSIACVSRLGISGLTETDCALR